MIAAGKLDEKAIFNVARHIPSPDSQREYLEHVCGGDLALIQRVIKLLRAFEDEQSFLESPLVGDDATVDPAPITERPGATIGHYKLLQELGEGGMGVVYMAEQRVPVQRQVALKIIKPGMDTRQVVARFEAERQALAMMDHQNIAHVLDAGATESGSPYFVMELVHGKPITEFCDDNDLTTRERLELFVQVCQAVQHAHQKGIIHRDLKPSNVMITMDGERAVPKVIDFGVAKATGQRLTEKTVCTGLGQMIGTPLYMSPEQAGTTAADIDTRSDIDSLGVLLYELLTGTTPFDTQRLHDVGVDEFRRVIREEEPLRPSTRISTLAGEAATTIASHRKTDRAKLNRTLRRDLDWIVMKALEKDRNRRYESSSDFAKDVQRYLDNEPVQACPPSTAYRMGKFYRRNKASLAFLGALALTLLIGAAVATGQAVRARKAEKMANQRLIETTKQRERAEQSYDKAREAVDTMVERLSEEYLAYIPQLKEARTLLLEDAAKLNTELIKLHPTDPQVYVSRATVYGLANRFTEQLADLEHAAELVPDDAVVQNRLAVFFLYCPDRRNCSAHRALRHAKRAVELEPKHAYFHVALANAMCGVGDLQDALAEAQKAIDLDPKEGQAYVARKNILEKMGKHALSLAEARKAVEANSECVWSHLCLAQACARSQQYEDALAAVRQAIELAPPNRTNSQLLYSQRADLLSRLGRHEDALVDYDLALSLNPYESFTWKRRAAVHFHFKNYDQALADIAKAVELKPDDTSNLTWIPPAESAKCADDEFRNGLLKLADKTIELTHGAERAYTARATLRAAFGISDERSLENEQRK